MKTIGRICIVLLGFSLFYEVILLTYYAVLALQPISPRLWPLAPLAVGGLGAVLAGIVFIVAGFWVAIGDL